MRSADRLTPKELSPDRSRNELLQLPDRTQNSPKVRLDAAPGGGTYSCSRKFENARSRRRDSTLAITKINKYHKTNYSSTQTLAVIRFPCASYLLQRFLRRLQRCVCVFCRGHSGGEERKEERRAEEMKVRLPGGVRATRARRRKLREVFAGTGRTWAHRERGGLSGCAGCGRIAARRVTAP